MLAVVDGPFDEDGRSGVPRDGTAGQPRGREAGMSTTAGPCAPADRTHATMLGDRFVDALGYATRVHRGQTRRDRPYVAHLLRVTGLVLEDSGTEDEAIGALLHDAAEDQGGYARLRDIRRRYGHAVADIVDSCTDSYEVPKPSWHVRKEQYVEHLADAQPSALLVSLADKVDNVRALLRDLDLSDARPGMAASSHADAASQDVCWYYGSLARVFEVLVPGPRAHELSRLAAELTRRTTLRAARRCAIVGNARVDARCASGDLR
jgi:hypothetical protein